MSAMFSNERHTAWCARNHQCAVALGEHRGEPIAIDVPGAGRGILQRVRDDRRRLEYAEVRLWIVLPDYEPHARYRLAALLTHLRTLIGPSPTRRGGGGGDA